MESSKSQDHLILFSYFRSSCSWRVRIALELKGLRYDIVPVQLMKSEQFAPEFLKFNLMGQVPALVINEKYTLTQSVAILEYLEERYPENPLLPSDLKQRASVRQICELIASGIQPLQNLSTLHKLTEDVDKKLKWAQYWITKGLKVLEELLQETSGQYCLGDSITLADCCLVPQVANAFRFKVDISPFKKIMEINTNLCKLEAFRKADASSQKDCPPEIYSKL